MMRQGLLGLALLSACANANPRGRAALKVDAAHPQWLAELQDERLGTATFRRLYDRAAQNQPFDASGFDVAEAFLLPMGDGDGALVGLQRSFWVCGYGARYHPGGISEPDFGERIHNAIVVFDASGRPTHAGSSGYFGPPLALVDANGDGSVEEFIHSTGDFVGDYRPFVTIMNVEGGELSVAFALEFNADARVAVLTADERPWESVTMEDGSVSISRAPWELDAIRHGGWSFAPNPSGHNDIVVSETVDGISRRVALFPYSPEERRWLYPDEVPDDAIWSVPEAVEVPLIALGRGGAPEPPTSLALSR